MKRSLHFFFLFFVFGFAALLTGCSVKRIDATSYEAEASAYNPTRYEFEFKALRESKDYYLHFRIRISTSKGDVKVDRVSEIGKRNTSLSSKQYQTIYGNFEIENGAKILGTRITEYDPNNWTYVAFPLVIGFGAFGAIAAWMFVKPGFTPNQVYRDDE